MADTERTPLLARSRSKASSNHGDVSSSQQSLDVRSQDGTTNKVKLVRHITMWHAVLIIMGNVIGSGIFVSPKGVTQNVHSVGASLVLWTVTGFINLGQALCYAELGGMIPEAGGDYAYLFYILGPLPAFLSAWLHILVVSASGCAVISRTSALYLIQPLGYECRNDVVALLAVVIIVSLAAINARSAIWGKRVHIVFTVAKTLALFAVIISGVVMLCKGHTQNFEHSFEGTSTDVGEIGLAVLDGYFAYKAWELINALPEEMVNPTKDLKPAVVIGMMSVTGIYVLTNVAYFSVLTPAELILSDAVAITYAEKALGWFAVIMPVFVALSCMGAVNGDFLANSRYLFAGGRFKQVPQVLSYIHIEYLTPFLAVAMLCVLAIMYCVFTNLQILQEYSSLAVQLKTLFALVALFYYRYKMPHIHRPFKVNMLVAIVTFLVTLCIVILSFYKSPVTTSIGIGVLVLGVPVYLLGKCCQRSDKINSAMDKFTKAAQKIFNVVPESKVTTSEAKAYE